jgi:hypothetical protein
MARRHPKTKQNLKSLLLDSIRKVSSTISDLKTQGLKTFLQGKTAAFKALPKKTQALSALLTFSLIAGIGWIGFTASDRSYLAGIESKNYSEYFANDSVALAQGRAFCEKMRSGAKAEGFGYELIAVQNFCPEFASGFVTRLTPEQQQAKLAVQLRKSDLAGEFTSEADAVQNAKAVCDALNNGAKQQGPLVSQISMQIYCPEFENGYRLLEPIKVKAKFVIRDRYPSSWFPAIYSRNGKCEGNYGYNDIDSSTSVKITNPDGKVLAKTKLGQGKGSRYKCTFTWELIVLEGEDTYILEVGKRGSLEFTESQLKIPSELDSGL